MSDKISAYDLDAINRSKLKRGNVRLKNIVINRERNTLENKTAKTQEWQEQGGTLTIPDGYYVSHVDFDVETPFIEIELPYPGNDKKKLLVPKSLAYYLSTHFCGSNHFREIMLNDEKRKVQSKIREALGL